MWFGEHFLERRVVCSPRLLARCTAVLGLGLVSLAFVRPSMAQDTPPPPPTNIHAVPPPSTRSEPGRVLKLKPGQKRVDPEAVRRAPTIHEYNAQPRPKKQPPLPPHPAIAPPKWRPNLEALRKAREARKALAAQPDPSASRPKPRLKPAANAAAHLSPSEQHLLTRYPALASEITPEALSEHLRALGRHESRAVGHSGERIAAEYVAAELRTIFGQITEEPFSVTVPVDQGGELRVAGQRFSVRALWPTPARGEQVPPEGLSAPVADLTPNGSVPSGRILLVEAGIAPEQLASVAREARALVLVEPKPAEAKGLSQIRAESLPESLPLFWISRTQAERLRAALSGGAAADAVLTSQVRWETVQARNFSAQIDGWDPLDVTDGGARLAGLLKLDAASRERLTGILRDYAADGGAANAEARARAEQAMVALLAPEQQARWRELQAARDQTVVLHAYYDASSAAPGLAPGSDQAVSMATLLELARAFRKYPPLRTVRFLATSGYFSEGQGLQAYVNAHHRPEIDPVSQPEGASAGVIVLMVLLGGGLGWSLYRGLRGKREAFVIAGLCGVLAVPLALSMLRTAPANPTTAAPTQPLIVTLNLSSAAPQVQGGSRDAGETWQRSVEQQIRRVGTVFGWDTVGAGSSVPTLVEEALLESGVRELQFVTAATSPYRGWPHDTLAHVQISNVTQQARTLACVLDHVFNDPDSSSEASR